jgi:hypothetical protein
MVQPVEISASSGSASVADPVYGIGLVIRHQQGTIRQLQNIAWAPPGFLAL